MKYTIPDIPPSNNKYIGRNMRWEYQQVKKTWLEIIALYCRPRPKEPLKNVKVKITYYFPDNRRRDPDNYSGKFILDGLTGTGIIKDDNFQNISLELKAKFKQSDTKTEIELKEREICND